MKRTRSLGLFLLLGLLLVVSGLPVTAQDPAVYYQITNNTGEWSLSQLPPPAAISGNGRKVAFNLDGTVYLANSDGSDTPQALGANAFNEVKIDYDGSRVLYSDGDSGGRIYLNGTDITPCVSDPHISEDVCLGKYGRDEFLALSGDGKYVFFVSRDKWACEPKQYSQEYWYWDCGLEYAQPRLWRVPTDGGSPQLWVDPFPDGLGWDVETDYRGTVAIWAARSTSTGNEEVYVGHGSNRTTRVFVGEDASYGEGRVAVSADGSWVVYSRADRSCSGGHHHLHIFRVDGSDYTTLDPFPYPAGYSYHVRGMSEDGARILFESDTSCQTADYRTFLVNRDGPDLTPLLSNTTFESQASSLSYDGQSVAFFSDEDVLGNGNTLDQVFVLKGPNIPDLSVDDFSLDLATVIYSAGKYTFPVDVTVRNTGEAPAAGISVRFSDNGSWSETRSIANLAPDASTVLHLDWDITGLLDAGQGKAEVTLTAAADPENVIVEASDLNNTATASTEVDVRPCITQVKSGYRPGTFLAGSTVNNVFDVWVDWNGELSGSGAADEPEKVIYALNGAQSVETVSDPAAAPAASHTYDMDSNLQPGTNVLRIQAENGAGFQSDSHTLTLHRANNAAWLAAVAVNVEAEPPNAPYDKIAVYKSSFSWPNDTLEGFFDVPANKVNVLKKEYGPSIDAWSLGVKFRSDGTGALKGSGGFEGEIKGMAALNATIQAAGDVRATDQLRLTKLEGSLRGEGEIATPRVPLSPWLPFLYTQAKIGAGADATLGVYEQANGKLEWSPLVLGLDATVEGTLSSGWENIAYVEGGVGGQPRGEFNLPSDPNLLRSLTVRLYAWGKGQFLVWEKGYEAEYEYVVSGPGGQTVQVYALQPHSTGWHLSDLSAHSSTANGTGPQAMDYAYADPALAIAADDTMMLVWVDDEATQLEIRASRWDGAAWSATADLSDNAFLDAHPDVAYDSAGQAVAMWTQLKDDTPPPNPHDALADMEMVYAVWDGMSWSTPVTLTNDAQLDLRPKVEADRSGHVMAAWLKDADGSYPLYPDEEAETLGGDLYSTLWNGSTWTSPTLAVSGVSSAEPPQLARDGDTALTVWSQDADGSVGTITDTAIYYATWISPTWGISQTLAGDGDSSADEAPRIAYDSAGRANLVWVKGRVAQSADPDDVVDQLYFATYSIDTWSTPVLAVEATAIQAPKLLVDAQDNLLVLWLARSDAGLDVWYAVYDRGTDLWSDPILFTHDQDAQADYDAVMDSKDTLRVVSTGREIITSTHDVTTTKMAGLAATQTIVYPDLGQVRPAEQQHTLGRDLTLTTLVVSPTNPAPGTTAVLTATAHNSGDLAVTGGQVALYNGDPNSGGTQIGVAQPLVSPFRAATTTTVSVQWDVPSALSSHTVYAVVDPADSITESVESNNQISLTVVLPDLDVGWVRADWFSDTITVTANTHNGGASPVTVPFTVALRADDPLSGPEITEEQVAASLSPGESVTLTLTITDPATILTGTHTAWVVADVGDTVSEADETNNTAFSALNVAPDLTLTAADIAGDGPIVVTIHNTGFISATDVVMAVHADGLTGTLLYSDTIGSLGPHCTAPVTLTVLAPDRCMLYVQLDPANGIPENDESNNLAVRQVEAFPRVYLPWVLRSY